MTKSLHNQAIANAAMSNVSMSGAAISGAEMSGAEMLSAETESHLSCLESYARAIEWRESSDINWNPGKLGTSANCRLFAPKLGSQAIANAFRLQSGNQTRVAT